MDAAPAGAGAADIPEWLRQFLYPRRKIMMIMLHLMILFSDSRISSCAPPSLLFEGDTILSKQDITDGLIP